MKEYIKRFVFYACLIIFAAIMFRLSLPKSYKIVIDIDTQHTPIHVTLHDAFGM